MAVALDTSERTKQVLATRSGVEACLASASWSSRSRTRLKYSGIAEMPRHTVTPVKTTQGLAVPYRDAIGVATLADDSQTGVEQRRRSLSAPTDKLCVQSKCTRVYECTASMRHRRSSQHVCRHCAHADVNQAACLAFNTDAMHEHHRANAVASVALW